jgi:hypothetical protein
MVLMWVLFHVVTVTSMEMAAFGYMRRVVAKLSDALVMETVGTSVTLVSFYETTRCYIP